MKTIFFIFFLFASVNAYAQEFVIIVNKEGPLLTVDVSLIKDIYLGDKRFSDDVKFKPVNSIEGPLKDRFLKEIIGMSSKEYKVHWIKKVFQEGLAIPATIAGVNDAVEFVMEEKGGIAYIPAGAAEDLDGVFIIRR